MQFTKQEIDQLIMSQSEGLALLEQYDIQPEVPVTALLPEDTVFLDYETMMEMYASLGITGGGIRSETLLDSALNRALQAKLYSTPTIQEMGLLVAEGIIRNHPFIDGNKRAAQLALCAFLTLNKCPCPKDSIQTAEIILGLATRNLDIETAGTYLKLCPQIYLDKGQSPPEKEKRPQKK